VREFFVGIHQPVDTKHFPLACVSIHRVEKRKKPLGCKRVLIDSGAFMKLSLHGCYPEPVEVYACQLHRLHTKGVVRIAAAVAQDYMCEPFMLAKTGLTVAEHQRLTIERYDALLAALRDLFDGPTPFPIMPVLQGFTPEEYIVHLRAYGDRLAPGMWVGVGSVCKRQGDPAAILAVLRAIKAERPDLRLHGFGVKLTALKNAEIRGLLHSADSMAWSFSARKQGRDGNSWREALAFVRKVQSLTPGVTNMKTLYLCGPINGCTDAECTDWREYAKTLWAGAVLDPMCRDYRGIEDAAWRDIVELDKIDVTNADVLLVNYDKPSVGTSMEILYAWERGKLVVVVAAPDARISPWLRYHSHRIVHSFAEAVQVAEQLVA